jgi:hypothetical protein
MYITALSCVAAAALLTGCGDDEAKISCGEGTQKVENKCTPEGDPVKCADGTTLTAGECVSNVACGAGTSTDATGKCVPDHEELECADGTKLEGTTCVPDTDTVCETGTSAVDGTCVADVVCGDGTTAREGECLSNDDLLALDADVTEEDVENDLNHGGTAQTVTLPMASETLTVAGGIGTPADKDNDGFADQDFDTYAIAGEAGDYLRLEAIDNGSGTVGFLVQGPNAYVRLSPTHENGGARKVLLPYDGNYAITVGPTSHFTNGSLGARGGDDANYVLAVENLGDFDTSTATTIDATVGESASGNFADLGDNLVAVNAPTGSTINVSFPELGIDATAAAILLDANGEVLGEQMIDAQGLVHVPASDDNLQILLDYVVLQGDRDAYTLAASTATPESIGETLLGTKTVDVDESTYVIPAGDSLFFTFDVAIEKDDGTAVPTGLVETVFADSDIDTIEYRVYDPNNERVRGFNALSGFHATVGGTYTLEVVNTDPLRTAEIAALYFASYVPADLGTFDATTTTMGDHSFATLPYPEFRLMTFETTEAVSATMASVQSTSESLQLFILADDLSQIAGAQGQAPGMAGVPLTEPGRYFGLIYNPGGFFGGTDATAVNTTLETAAAPAQATEPNNSVADATPIADTDTRMVGTLEGGPMRDYDIYEIATGITDPTLVEASIFSMAAAEAGTVAVELRDENGVLYDITGDSSTAFVGAVLQPGTSYYLHVYRTSGFAPLPYSVSVAHNGDIDAALETEPNEMDTDAVTMAGLTAPTAFLAGGTLAGNADVDWYEFQLPLDSFVSLEVGALGNLAAGTDVDMEFYEDDGTGMLTQVTLEDLMDLDSGRKLIKVSGGTATGYANSYTLRASVISPSALPAPTMGQLDSETGTFDVSGKKLFTIELGADLATDDSETFVLWSDAQIDVLDASMQPIHSGTEAGAAFSSTTLTAGTYFVRLTGTDATDWQLYSGILASTMETEPNDSDTETNDLGALSTGSVEHIFGTIDDTDTNDWFTFTVPDVDGNGSAQDVVIEQMEFGESLQGYLERYLYDDVNTQITNTWIGTLFSVESLEPGTYSVEVTSWSGSGSADYLMRVYLQ